MFDPIFGPRGYWLKRSISVWISKSEKFEKYSIYNKYTYPKVT